MAVGGVNCEAITWTGIAQRAQEALIGGPVARNVVLQIHGLNAEIETLGRRIRGLGRDGISFAEDWRVAVYQERGARAGIDENGLADHDSFKRLQFDT